jgi:FKBP-type peptidyl-prolyl cis-trans isomerase FkpA
MSLVLAGLGIQACGDSPTDPSDLPSVTIQEMRVGTGAVASAGRLVVVDYTGWVQDANQPEQKGIQFDSSYGDEPFAFFLGVGQVIPGWDLGIPSMRVGGQRRMTIPPALAYGSQAVGAIPPNSTLIFEVELLAVQ